ncbi:hypothetical protein [Shewanella dokdonensis]|uniref:Uncharacterized protein n=1 Tax=Shewanella dokdonensis TaxID=712036 RepID=A0ABX8DAY8_9GAMM|nr:hypothetical protein [Shewanella dokdonensis]MCL1075305.1 hypothetical protein [Shewanella dokdonensis]QVK22022.1 hypothetical protein KHX94_11065 [Shewanella dokdonensis]
MKISRVTTGFHWLGCLGCGLLGLLLMPLAQAEVTHVSINQRLFDLGKLPLIKVNIVAAPTDPDRMQFILRQKSGEEKLMVQPINNYLLLLMGLDEVTDADALLLVQLYQTNQWQEISQLPLFAKTVPVGNPPDPARFSMYRNPVKPSVLPPSEIVPATEVVPPAPMPASRAPEPVAPPKKAVTEIASAQCLLDYHGTETLWHLASRYAKQWRTHVYAAALAIMEANPKAFVKGKPGNLRSDAQLHCPQPAQWQSYQDKALAKEKFEALL